MKVLVSFFAAVRSHQFYLSELFGIKIVDFGRKLTIKLSERKRWMHYEKRCNDFNRRGADRHGDCPPYGIWKEDCNRR